MFSALHLLLLTVVELCFVSAENEKELLLVQTVWRHGDKSPSTTYPTDWYQEDYWTFGGGGWGQLSTLGMEQQVKLGIQLRNRYITEVHKRFLTNRYNSKEVYYRSTDSNRTLISALANTIGMWSQAENDNRPNTDYPTSPLWPTGFVPIPIHTVDYSTDYVVNPEASCDRQYKLWNMAKNGPEMQEYLKTPQVVNLMNTLSEYCGMTITSDSLWMVAGAYEAESIHAPDMHTKNSWFTPELNLQVVVVNSQLQRFQNGIFNSTQWINGLDVGLEIQKIRGGSLINDLEMHMNIKIDCLRKNMTEGECKWISGLKFYAHSGHDTTVFALLTALGIQSDVLTSTEYPAYSSAVIVELWYDRPTDKPYFKILYRKGDETPFETVTQYVDSCEDDLCLLSAFQSRSQRIKPDEPMNEWCEVDPTKSSFSSSSSSVFVIIVMIVFSVL